LIIFVAMKKIARIFLYRIALLTGMRWLIFAAGIALLSSVQSCRSGKNTCYQQIPANNNDTINATCYGMPAKKVTPDVSDEPVFAPDDEYDWFEEMEDLDRDR
jgi:hypothetical protein